MNKKLSVSRINLLNKCSQAHYYAYTLGLEKPGETNAQALGTAVHKAIEEFYNGVHNMPHMDTGAAYANEYNACVDAFGTFSLLRDKGLSILATEQEFSVPLEDERISEGWEFRGIIDVVAELDGQLWVGDHKTTRRKWSIEKLSLSLQHKGYELVMPELYPGKNYGGSFYNFIQIGTSKSVPYANVSREWLPRNEAGLATAFEEIISAVQRIEAGEKFRNVGDHCTWCDFKDLCGADYFGADTQALIDLNFRKKDQKIEEGDEL